MNTPGSSSRESKPLARVRDAVADDAANVPEVASPYEGKQLTILQHLRFSAYWFATNFVWGALLVIMLPTEVHHMAPIDRVSAIALLGGLSAIVALIAPLIAGELSDRCASRFGRRRPFMVLGVLINLIGFGLMAVVYAGFHPLGASNVRGFMGTERFLLSDPAFLIFLAAYMVVQLGSNIALAAYSGIIPDLVPTNQRGIASGYMALMSQLGTLAGVIVCGQVLVDRSKHLKLPAVESTHLELIRFLAVGAVLALVTLISVLGIKEVPLPARPPKIHWGTYLKSLWIDPRLYPDFGWVWITRAMVMLGFYSVLPFVNYYFVDVIGIEHPDMAASLMTAALLISSCISGVYGGILSDRIGRKRVVYFANMMIAVVAVSFIFCRTIPQVLVAGSIFGFGYGAYISVDWALGTDVLPSKKSAAKEMGVWHIAMTLPQTIASPIAGGLIAFFGKREYMTPEGVPGVHYTISGYAAVFILCAVCFALGAYFLKNVRSVR